MATQYSTLLKLALPTQGELSGAWGDVVNNNITSMVEEAVAGLKTINTWSGNSATLSTADGTTAEARAAMLNLTDTTSDLSGAATLICPALSKVFIVKNGTGQTVTVKTASGSGIAISNGNTSIVFCDGTNVVEAVTGITGNLDIGGNLGVGGNLTVTGTTTFNGGTVTLGDANTDNIVFGGEVDSNIIPDDDGTYDLGSSSKEWKDIYIDGVAYLDSIDLNGTAITATAAEINLIDGGATVGTTAIADGDGLIINDAGTMRVSTVQTLAAYLDDEITAMPNLVTTAATTVGALDSGSITSGFGTIDTGSSTITTTGLITGGSLDIDDVVINGTTIGHTDDTDLITVASGLVTVAGEISVTTLDIGGTNVTSTATELNLLDGVSGLVQADFTKLAALDATAAELNLTDGGSSIGTTAVSDGHGILMNHGGTMAQTTVQTLAAYLDDEITAMPNLVTVSTLNSGAISSGFGAVDIGSSNLTATGTISLGATSFNDNAITNVGDIALDSISADGTDINVAVSDNSATALTIKQGSDAYLIIDTANSSESVSIGTGVSGTAIVLGHSTSEVTVADNLTVTGNLTISGTTTTVNSTTVNLNDHNIVLDSGNSTSAVINGAGITIEGGSGSDATFTYNTTGPQFELKLGSSFEDLQTAKLTASEIDLNGNLNASGTSTLTGNVTLGGQLIMPDVTSAKILVADGTSFQEVAVSGDVTIANTGAVTIAAQAVENSMLADDAVGADELAANAVVTASIVDDNVTQAKIADDAVGADQLAANAVVEASIVDNAVTLAKMAGIARGKLIIGDSSGNPSVIGPGSANQILTSDGTDIAFADPASGGSAADDISAGDAAVTITTSSGNITIDAAANNSDIIFKGTDGGADITMLTLDGSEDGAAAFKSTVATTGLIIGGTAVTSTAAELNILDGVTSTAAELNILDGVTSTTAELNILDGVTSTTAELNILDGVTATTAELNYSDTGQSVGTVVASKVVTVDSNKDVASFRNITLTGELDAGSLDVSGNADIDGTLEADAITVNGTALDEFIEDTVGAMLSSNTESGITVTYQDGDGTIDFTVGTLNQDTTGSAATLTTARTIGGVSFDGSANINLPGVNTAGNQNTSGSAATLTNARTIGGVSFNGSANINLPGVNTAGNQATTGNAATATKLATARSINGTNFDGSANITTAGTVKQVVQSTQTTRTIVSGSSFTTVHTATITPTASSSKILVMTSYQAFLGGTNTSGNFELLINSSVNSEAARTQCQRSSGSLKSMPSQFNTVDSPNTTSQVTYTIQARRESGSDSLSYCENNRHSVVVLMEVSQ